MKYRLGIILLCLMTVILPRSSEAITVAINNDPNGVFEGTSTGTNPSNGQETSVFNLATAYQNLYGQPSPNPLPAKSMWGETPTELTFGFNAEGKDVAVNVFQELDLDVFGNYWTLDSKITFDPSSAIIVDPNDHIMWEGTLQHFGKLSTNDFPHEGDTLEGPLLRFAVNLSAGDKTPAMIGQLSHAVDANAAEHPNIGHADAVIAALQARVESPSIFFDEIEGAYTGLMVGFHLKDEPPVVPEPATLGLVGSGILGMPILRRRKK